MGVGNLASLTRGGNLNLMTLLLLDDFLYFFLETFLVNFFAVFLGFADRDRDLDFGILLDCKDFYKIKISLILKL